jgi:hypothetical protein
MNGHADISKILDAWPYDPEKNVRVVRLAEGRRVLQVRLPLGIEQYELDGRPDGRRPHGRESVLDYQLSRLRKAGSAGREHTFQLSPAECADLFEEGVLYYYRYLHLFQIEDWRRTIRDTERNIRLFDFVKRYAAEEDDRNYLEQWRPYITRMHAVASAMIELKKRRHDEALRIVNDAIARIEHQPEVDEPAFLYEQERSLAALREVAAHIQQTRPVPEVVQLERELHRAVEAEEFERAAKLRDRIRVLKGRKTLSSHEPADGPA